MPTAYCRTVLTAVAMALLAATTAEGQSARAKGTKKASGAEGKIAGELAKWFRVWDRDKDEHVAKVELEHAYIKARKAKPPAGQAVNPADAAIEALLAAADKDQDGRLSRAEYDAWAASFTNYLVQTAQVQQQIAQVQQDRAQLSGLKQGSGNVTALDGIFQSEANRGIMQYDRMLEEANGKLKQLADEGGHSGYVEFFHQELSRKIRR